MRDKSPEAIASKIARGREVRDLYNKLKKKYKHQVVDKFFRENYFIQPRTVETIIQESDNNPVDLATASLIYKYAMDVNFSL